ncbi:acetyltransferase (GNAT) family protein [Kribbella orskensis]|uniref:Acetyltransferase (GNAT) family protein n=1 Tax=Kribbella orskensis TaxID=2512216 RepID=A0ABY2BCW3_9ACTN|nr:MULTISPECIES: GNAT family N-acetyltransferase [Kribbella]TCN35304.1 acetyltransferase (GNAT) family protein [Kribbella sp. VKM Ac-2500]TCO16725.1 acetyltransferase (GNAT) family protein [Kribbella orskensis]
MGELNLATVAAANEAWVLEPEGSQVAETAEYRLVRFPERFPDPLQLQWVRSARPAEAVLGEVVARAVEFGLPEVNVYVRLSAPDGFVEALLGYGAQLVDTGDVLALALPADVKAPDVPGLEVRWLTALEVARDANAVGVSVFGGSRASDDELAPRAAAYRDSVAAGTGGLLVGYLDGTPVAVAGVELVDSVARLWGGAVLEAYRGRGVYRALLAARMTYAAEHGGTMALTQGRITTSSPILQRLGFISYGREHSYRLPLR